jgi:glycosyltransferase involved in cell wall biosynthesis
MISEKQPLFPEVGVLALVPDRWEPRWQARHHIVSRLARYFEVVWLEHAPSWRSLFSRRSRAASRAYPSVEPSLQIYVPGWRLPEFGRPAWLANLTSQERLRQARKLLLRRGCTKIVFYAWRPQFARVLNQISCDLSCYHIDDEYSFSPIEVELDPVEVRLIRSVGQVFIHSPAMMEKKGGLNPNTEFVPNGVDYQKYTSPVPEPRDLHGIRHPRIGYAGNLKRMLDWPLLLHLSSRHPEWSFVFLGHIDAHREITGMLTELFSRPNVYMLGEKPTDEVAGYVQHFDVCMMPYRIDDYTKYIYPLKLHEYLASGRPVVGSRIPSLRKFDDVVLLAETPEEWSKAIAHALTVPTNSPQLRGARQNVARAHDWDVLVRKIANTILHRLGIQPSDDWNAGSAPNRHRELEPLNS